MKQKEEFEEEQLNYVIWIRIIIIISRIKDFIIAERKIFVKKSERSQISRVKFRVMQINSCTSDCYPMEIKNIESEK